MQNINVVNLRGLLSGSSPKKIITSLGMPKYYFDAVTLGFTLSNNASIGNNSLQLEGAEPIFLGKVSATSGGIYKVVDGVNYLDFNFTRYSGDIFYGGTKNLTLTLEFMAGAVTSQRLVTLGSAVIGITVSTSNTLTIIAPDVGVQTIAGYKPNALNKVVVHLKSTGSVAVLNGVVTQLNATIPPEPITKIHLMGSQNLTVYTSNYLVSKFGFYEGMEYTESDLIRFTL